ncbi:DUF3829 domain-containing protein [Phreatobacter sp.]|uniref:DUF3829 domain-containing protein n=1 Tax=Phreatobacter sp. TaxID=1966341 RepID=UPI003F6E73B9
MRHTPSRSLSSSQLSRRSIALFMAAVPLAAVPLAALPLTTLAASARPMLVVTMPAELGGDLLKARLKVAAYADVVDATMTLPAMWRRYTSQIHVERGPTGREIRIGGFNPLRDMSRELAAAETQRRSGPAFSDCDAAMADLIGLHGEMASLVNEAAAHFGAGGHRQDGGEQARALHHRLHAVVPAYLAARQSARDRLEAIRSVVETAELAAFERATGRDGRWFIRRATVEARKVMAVFPRAGGIIDTAALEAALVAYEAFAGEFEAHAAANPESVGPFGRAPRGFAVGIRRVQERIQAFPASPKRWAPEIGDIEPAFQTLSQLADALLRPAA